MPSFRPTKIDLQESVRKKSIKLLNENLVDSIHLSIQSKQAHWNVKGPNFFQFHELFDKIYEESTEWTDLLAERVAQLGGVAEANLESITRRTRLSSYSLDIADGLRHVDALSSSLAIFCKNVRKAIDDATGFNDIGTADLLTEISRGADAKLWFLDAHLFDSKANARRS